MYIEKWRVLEHFWSQGDTLLSPTRVAILAGLETASLGLYALIYRVGSMRLDRFNVWGSGRSGHVSDSERRGQRGSLQVNRCVAEQIPASSCTSTEQQQQRQGDAEQQHHSSSSRHHLLSHSILETPRSLCRQRGRHVHQASSQQSTS